jgi:hypothetical protein
VPEHQKITGHQLAGQWLEQAGEHDPQVLAEHARLGQQPQRAIPFYLQAAEQLFARNDNLRTARCVETALRKALQCLHRRAREIPDVEARERFLRQVPENARTLELTR